MKSADDTMTVNANKPGQFKENSENMEIIVENWRRTNSKKQMTKL